MVKPIEPEKPDTLYIRFDQKVMPNETPFQLSSHLAHLSVGERREQIAQQYQSYIDSVVDGSKGSLYVADNDKMIELRYELQTAENPKNLVYVVEKNNERLNELQVYNHLLQTVDSLGRKKVELDVHYQGERVESVDGKNLGRFSIKGIIEKEFYEIFIKNYTEKRQIPEALRVTGALNEQLDSYVSMHRLKLAEIIDKNSILGALSAKWYGLKNPLSGEVLGNAEEIDRGYSGRLERIINNLPTWVTFNRDAIEKISENPDPFEALATRRFQNIISHYFHYLRTEAGENVAINIHEKYMNDFDGLAFIFNFSKSVDWMDTEYNARTVEKILTKSLWLLNSGDYKFDDFRKMLGDANTNQDLKRKSDIVMTNIIDKIRKENTAKLSAEEIERLEQDYIGYMGQ
ncbi:MAG: hypothetical protein U9O94_06875 [Nanoarchaeota archaeon]|nr:hypothetical protein [Nanoarchaeota archaeon]